jgi:hypothetical protein
MTEQLKTCTGCETCWLTTDLADIGTDFDNGTLARSKANDKISKVSQKAGLAGCSNEKIVAARGLLVRVNRSLGMSNRTTFIPSLTPADQYLIERDREIHDSHESMRGFSRGRSTLGRGLK